MSRSELQKMLAGELYSPNEAELTRLRNRARKLMRQYNESDLENREHRASLIRELLGAVGANTVIEPPFYCDYGLHITAGDNLFMNFGCTVLDCAEVRLGESVFLGPNVQIYTATHPLDAQERCSGRELAKAISIGNRVWIGGGAIVCPGVSIGDDTTIGAGSVVTRDVPSRVLAAGNPCRVIRSL